MRLVVVHSSLTLRLSALCFANAVLAQSPCTADLSSEYSRLVEYGMSEGFLSLQQLHALADSAKPMNPFDGRVVNIETAQLKRAFDMAIRNPVVIRDWSMEQAHAERLIAKSLSAKDLTDVAREKTRSVPAWTTMGHGEVRLAVSSRNTIHLYKIWSGR